MNFLISFAPRVEKMNVVIDFGRTVKKLFLAMENYGDELLKPFHLSHEQWRILFLVKFNEGCDQQFIADETFRVKSAITAQLSKLGKAGLVARIPDEKDNRSKRVYLTDKGKDVADSGLHIITEHCEQYLEAYPKQEVERMITMMQEVTEKLIEDKNKSSQKN